jgi:RNA polymerase sigma-70 factor (ECF subfamily)
MCMDPESARSRWAQAYKDEFPRVYRALVAVLRNRELARDALQDAFLEGVRRPPGTDENLAGWLFRVALRRSRRGPYGTPLGGIGRFLLPDRRDEVAETLDRMEVARLLGMLSERQRSMVVAQYYLGLDQEEIARLFGVRRGTVAATLAQAKARMRTGGQHAS